ncbi:MAG: hypothetical protein JW910_23160, partial [Anaerolineae bacterium]|nr:hypothetical protein [Anaerolineae bacterium]
MGAIERWDERDIVFARHDLFRYFGTDSPQYKSYYAAHPDKLAYDARISKQPGLGRTGGIDEPMFSAQFDIMDKISPNAFVDGEPAPNKIEIPPDRAARKVKALARVLGADLVGTGPLRQEWVYSHV